MALEAEAEGGRTASDAQATADEERIKRSIQNLWQRAKDHFEYEIGPKLARAYRYYDGKVDFEPAYEVGRDETGKPVFQGNATVVREVWDKVHAVLPELARVFLSSDEAVAYTPKRPDQQPWAEQATDYANYVFKVENDGEEQLLEAFVAWLIKFCAWKVYWTTETREEHGGGRVGEAAFYQLQQQAQDPNSDIVSVEGVPVVETVQATQVGPDGQPVTMAMPVLQYDVKVVREIKEGQIRIELIPQDEFVIDPDAMSVDEALFVGQDCLRTVSSVVAMGVPFDVVREKAGRSSTLDRNTAAATARRGRSNDQTFASDIGDPALDYVRVVEAVVQVDTDGDGIAERRRVLMLGDMPEVVAMSGGDDCYYIVGSPYRRPHDPIGMGVAEAVIDLQDDKTRLTRGIHNNINRANTPRQVISADDAEAYRDLKGPLGPNGSGVIRSSNPAAITFNMVPYVGDRMFPMLEYYDNLGATRTGITPAGQGLDADILKGTTVDGTKLVANSAQTRIEYLVREFAAGIMRPMFSAILKLATKYQDKATTVRIRGDWVEVDPSAWGGELDVTVQVGLGTGTRTERLAGIMAIITQQMQAMLNPATAPLVSAEEYGNALRKMVELVGFPNTQQFVKEITAEQLAQMQQQAAEQQKAQLAEQAQMAAMVEAQKAEAKARVDAEVKLQEATLADQQHAREVQSKDALAAQAAAAAEAQAQRDHARALAEVAARERAALDKQLRDFELKKLELEMERSLEELRMKHQSPGGNANLPQASES